MLVDGQVSVELIKDKKHASSSKKAAGASSLKTPARTPEAWASRQWGDTPLELKLTLYRDAKVTAPPQACTPIALSCGSERQNLRPSLSLSRSLACMHTHSVVLSCSISLARAISPSLSLSPQGSFLQKPFVLRLLDASPGALGKAVAEFALDAGMFVRPGALLLLRASLSLFLASSFLRTRVRCLHCLFLLSS